MIYVLRTLLIHFCFAVVCYSAAFATAETSNAISMEPRTWIKNEVTREGEKTIVGTLSPFPTDAERRAFPYRIMLVIEYDKEGSQRLPNDEEQKKFDGYEAAVRAEFEKDSFGLPVLSLANDGIYQLVLYAKEGAVGEIRLLSALPQSNRSPDRKGLEVMEFHNEHDPQWLYVSGLVKQ